MPPVVLSTWASGPPTCADRLPAKSIFPVACGGYSEVESMVIDWLLGLSTKLPEAWSTSRLAPSSPNVPTRE
jgi:hypothetical protein